MSKCTHTCLIDLYEFEKKNSFYDVNCLNDFKDKVLNFQ
jgi:hypothetical protein